MNSGNRFDISIGAITTDLKKGLADARAELNKFSKEATKGFGMTEAIEKEVVANQKLIQEINKTKLAGAQLTLEKRKGKTATDAAIGSYDEAQRRLTALGRSIKQSSEGFSSNGAAVRKQITEYNELNTKLKEFDKTMGNNQRNVGNYALGLGNASGVTMEFTRIIQDAPYGMIGIGNNIQQLTANWQQYAEASRKASLEQGKTLTTGALLRGALSSLISPASLLSLGVAALTSGWTIYTMWAQKSAKATKENEDVIAGLVKNLNNTSDALYKASQASGSEVAQLRILYNVANDATKSTNERRKASEQLISKYPDLFKNIGAEGIMLGQAKTAYDKLTTSILATARAQAAYGKIGEKASAQLAIDETNAGLREQISLLDKRIKKSETYLNVGTATTATGEATEAGQIRRINELYSSRNDLNKQLTTNLLERAKLQSQINDLEGIAVTNQDKIIVNNGKLYNTKQVTDYLSKVKDIAQKSQFSLDIANSEGLDKELERNKQKYQQYLDELDRIKNNKTAIKQDGVASGIDSARLEIIKNQELEAQQIRLKYEQETQDLINKILQDAGVSRINSRQKELDANRNYYSQLEDAHRNNAKVIESITEARRVSENSINEKWDNKAYDDISKIQDKIKAIEEKSFTVKEQQDPLKKVFTERLNQIDEYYKKIQEILDANNLTLKNGGLVSSFNAVDSQYSSGSTNNSKLENRLARTIENGLRKGIDDILGDIDNLGSNFYDVFSNVFGKLSDNFTNVMTGVISTSLSDGLSEKFSSGEFEIKGLSNNLSKALVAGATLGGKILGGLISQSSAVGQAGAGALSGAGAGGGIGALFSKSGGIWGAAIGGVIGLVSGIFGSKKAKKEEELQKQQLEEQKKQTALMERQALLAYSSSVIGQMTNQGVVTGVDRDAFGNLAVDIKGSTLQLVLDRAKSERGN